MTSRGATAKVVSEGQSFTRRRAARRRYWQIVLGGYLLILPGLSLILLFVVLPTLQAIYLSFHEETLFTGGLEWVGLDNYRNMLTGSFASSYLNSVRVTLLFSLYTVPASLLLGLAIALLVDRAIAGIELFRSLIFISVAVSTAIASIAGSWLLNTDIGYLNYLLSFLNIPKQGWLTDSSWALLSVSAVTVWQSLGFTAILMLAGLQNISPEYYAAAKIDGASVWARFWHITLPLLSPTLFIVGIITAINSLTAFGQVHVLTRGGPVESTNLLAYNLYRDAFLNFRPGFASAQAVILFIALSLITLFQFRFLGRKVHYQ